MSQMKGDLPQMI